MKLIVTIIIIKGFNVSLLDDELESETLLEMIVQLNKAIKEKRIQQELPKQDLDVLEAKCSYELDDYERLKARCI